MESFQIVVSGNSTDLTTNFSPPLMFFPEKKYEMALVNLETYYSFPNIDTSNNIFKYNNGTANKTITLPTGSYELLQINTEIQRQMTSNGDWDSTNSKHYITIGTNFATLKSTINITNPAYKVDFTSSNTVRTLLGFNSKILKSGYYESDDLVNIMNINSIFVNVDCISESYVNGTASPVLYSFYPNVGPGYKIIQSPNNLVYLPLNKNALFSIKTWITDQNSNLLNLRGENVTIRFHIRSK